MKLVVSRHVQAPCPPNRTALHCRPAPTPPHSLGVQLAVCLGCCGVVVCEYGDCCYWLGPALLLSLSAARVKTAHTQTPARVCLVWAIPARSGHPARSRPPQTLNLSRHRSFFLSLRGQIVQAAGDEKRTHAGSGVAQGSAEPWCIQCRRGKQPKGGHRGKTICSQEMSLPQ